MNMPTKTDPFIEKLSTLNRTEPVHADESASYGDILKLLQDRQTGAVVLTHKGRVSGVFTERDVLNKCLLDAVDPATPVRDLMTRSPVTVPTDATVGEAIALMHEHKVRNLPLVDGQGRLLGLLTVGRLIRYLASVFPAEVVNLPPKPSQVTEEVEGA